MDINVVSCDKGREEADVGQVGRSDFSVISLMRSLVRVFLTTLSMSLSTSVEHESLLSLKIKESLCFQLFRTIGTRIG